MAITIWSIMTTSKDNIGYLRNMVNFTELGKRTVLKMDGPSKVDDKSQVVFCR